jgi:hypothetical protein
MAFPNEGNFDPTKLDNPTDSPTAGRQEIYQAMLDLDGVIKSRGDVNGLASLDGEGHVPEAELPVVPLDKGGTGASDAAGARLALGAQAELGYEPVNKAGDTMSGLLELPRLRVYPGSGNGAAVADKIFDPVSVSTETTAGNDVTSVIMGGLSGYLAEKEVTIEPVDGPTGTEYESRERMSLYGGALAEGGTKTEVYELSRTGMDFKVPVNAPNYLVNGEPMGSGTIHNNLDGLNAGDYQHLSAAEKTDLTDGGQSTAHGHPASLVVPVTTNFNHALTSADNTVQKALETLDQAGVKKLAVASITAPSELDSIVGVSMGDLIWCYQTGNPPGCLYTYGSYTATSGGLVRGVTGNVGSWYAIGPRFTYGTINGSFGALGIGQLTYSGANFELRGNSASKLSVILRNIGAGGMGLAVNKTAVDTGLALDVSGATKITGDWTTTGETHGEKVALNFGYAAESAELSAGQYVILKTADVTQGLSAGYAGSLVCLTAIFDLTLCNTGALPVIGVVKAGSLYWYKSITDTSVANAKKFDAPLTAARNAYPFAANDTIHIIAANGVGATGTCKFRNITAHLVPYYD